VTASRRPWPNALAGLYLDGIWIPLYASDARGHDSVTRRAGSFRRAIGAIRALVERDQPVTINGFPRTAGLLDQECLVETAGYLECPIALDPLQHLRDLPNHTVAAEAAAPPLESATARRPAIFVMSDGRVSPCRAHPMNAGTVVHDSVADLWQESPELREAALLPLVPQPGCNDCPMRTSCFC
jgi:radical SAM protein with 4Fe4S-binding SPASM domain